jgi:hypothetical protein
MSHLPVPEIHKRDRDDATEALIREALEEEQQRKKAKKGKLTGQFSPDCSHKRPFGTFGIVAQVRGLALQMLASGVQEQTSARAWPAPASSGMQDAYRPICLVSAETC